MHERSLHEQQLADRFDRDLNSPSASALDPLPSDYSKTLAMGRELVSLDASPQSRRYAEIRARLLSQAEGRLSPAGKLRAALRGLFAPAALRLAVIGLFAALLLVGIWFTPRLLPGTGLLPGGAIVATQTHTAVRATSTVTSPVPTAPISDTSVYTVQAGDTWISIANKFNMRVTDLLHMNHLPEGSDLRVGQTLVVKAGPRLMTPTAPFSDASIYTVQVGDTWPNIAQKFNMSVADLLYINHLPEGADIVVGQTIIVQPGLRLSTPDPAFTPIPTPDPLVIYKPFEYIETFPLEDNALRTAHFKLSPALGSLPDAPDQAMVYHQKGYHLPLTAERAKAVAALFDLSAEPTPRVSEGNDLAYSFSQGDQGLNVFADDPMYFTYGTTVPTPATDQVFTFDERAQSAVAFLSAHRPLNFDYEVLPGSPLLDPDHAIAILQKIDGRLLVENSLSNPRIVLSFSGSGQVNGLIYHQVGVDPLSLVSIRPASAAWADLQSHRSGKWAALRVYGPKDRRGSLAGNSVPIGGAWVIDRIELAYFAQDYSHASLGALSLDFPGRLIVPIWRFTGTLEDGRVFEILTEAVTPGTRVGDAPTAPSATADPTPEPLRAEGAGVSAALVPENESVNDAMAPEKRIRPSLCLSRGKRWR